VNMAGASRLIHRCKMVSSRWERLSTDVVRALQDVFLVRKTVLPALHKLYIPQPEPRHAPLSEATVSFMTSRRLSGHPIAVEYERLCRISELRGTGTIYAQCLHRYSLTR
jgi:hypothetical protein